MRWGSGATRLWGLDFLSLNGRIVVSQLYEVDDIENFDLVFDAKVLNSS
jgi:hypothetical protein